MNDFFFAGRFVRDANYEENRHFVAIYDMEPTQENKRQIKKPRNTHTHTQMTNDSLRLLLKESADRFDG